MTEHPMGHGTQPDAPTPTHDGLEGEELRLAQDEERHPEMEDKDERDAHNERMADDS
jgi:hypothetical protein